MFDRTVSSLVVVSLCVGAMVSAQAPVAPTPVAPVPAAPTAAPAAQPAAPAVPAAPAADDFQAAKPKILSKREVTAQLQIFLDQKLFSPGMIDGKEGRFLREALKRWQRANGFPETGVLDDNVPLASIYPVYTFHKVEKAEFKFIGDLPSQPSAQSLKKKLPYSNYTEFLAERYHCSIEFLERLNPTVKFATLDAGMEVRVPNVEPFKIEEMPETGNFPENPDLKARRKDHRERADRAGFARASDASRQMAHPRRRRHAHVPLGQRRAQLRQTHEQLLHAAPRPE
jgi:hypothetical protein